MSRRHVEVHIEELVLHGFPPLDERAVGEAVERELAALVTARPGHGAASLDAGSFDAASLGPGFLGAGIARRVGDALA